PGIGGADVRRDPRLARGLIGRIGDRQAEVERVAQGALLQVGEQLREQAPARPEVGGEGGAVARRQGPGGIGEDRDHPPREAADGALVIVEGQADLLEVVDAGGAPGRLAGGLDGRQQECDQHRDDGDHDQEFDQGESSLQHSFLPSIQAELDSNGLQRELARARPYRINSPRNGPTQAASSGSRKVPGPSNASSTRETGSATGIGTPPMARQTSRNWAGQLRPPNPPDDTVAMP